MKIIEIKNYPLYIAVKERGAKKHTPFSFRIGYTNLLGATRYSIDKLDCLKEKLTEYTNEGISAQIVDSRSKKVLFRIDKIR